MDEYKVVMDGDSSLVRVPKEFIGKTVGRE